MADEQLVTHSSLQPPDGLGQRGLGHPECLCGAAHVPRFGNHQEVFNPAEEISWSVASHSFKDNVLAIRKSWTYGKRLS